MILEVVSPQKHAISKLTPREPKLEDSAPVFKIEQSHDDRGMLRESSMTKGSSIHSFASSLQR